MEKCTLEHWRDEEVIEQFELTHDMIKTLPDGSVFIVFPPGRLTFVTQDEIHFDPKGLKELL